MCDCERMFKICLPYLGLANISLKGMIQQCTKRQHSQCNLTCGWYRTLEEVGVHTHNRHTISLSLSLFPSFSKHTRTHTHTHTHKNTHTHTHSHSHTNTHTLTHPKHIPHHTHTSLFHYYNNQDTCLCQYILWSDSRILRSTCQTWETIGWSKTNFERYRQRKSAGK